MQQVIQEGHTSLALEHDPEKWKPVFRKDHAQTKSWSGNRFCALAIAARRNRCWLPNERAQRWRTCRVRRVTIERLIATKQTDILGGMLAMSSHSANDRGQCWKGIGSHRQKDAAGIPSCLSSGWTLTPTRSCHPWVPRRQDLGCGKPNDDSADQEQSLARTFRRESSFRHLEPASQAQTNSSSG